MNEAEALSHMVPPGQYRPYVATKRGGILQIQITRACNLACTHCTQASNLGGKPVMITLEEFEAACRSLVCYPGVVGIFGGCPTLHPEFVEICDIFRSYFPYEQRGLWCNDLINEEKAAAARITFNPKMSNLNVHLNAAAYDRFQRWWPESEPFGLHEDSRHSPCFVAMKDLIDDEGERWRLISDCDVNQKWSALVGVVPHKGLRAFFCEIAYTQAVLHAEEPDYPDVGLVPYPGWWQLPMTAFADQVRKACHDCGVPLRGYGALATDGVEQVSAAHAAVYKSKVKGRRIELVTVRSQLGPPLQSTVEYIANARGSTP